MKDILQKVIYKVKDGLLKEYFEEIAQKVFNELMKVIKDSNVENDKVMMEYTPEFIMNLWPDLSDETRIIVYILISGIWAASLKETIRNDVDRRNMGLKKPQIH